MISRVWQTAQTTDPSVPLAILTSHYGFTIEACQAFPLTWVGNNFYLPYEFARPFNDLSRVVWVDYLMTRWDLARGIDGAQFIGERACGPFHEYHYRINLPRTCDGLLAEFEQGNLTELKVKQALPDTGRPRYNFTFFTRPNSDLLARHFIV